MGSNKFLAKKKYEAICSLCLAEAKGHPFTGMEGSFLWKRWVLGFRRKRRKRAEPTDAGSSAGSANPSVFINEGGGDQGNASDCCLEGRTVTRTSAAQSTGVCVKRCLATRRISRFPGIKKEAYKPSYWNPSVIWSSWAFFSFSIKKEERRNIFTFFLKKGKKKTQTTTEKGKNDIFIQR